MNLLYYNHYNHYHFACNIIIVSSSILIYKTISIKKTLVVVAVIIGGYRPEVGKHVTETETFPYVMW